MDGKVSSSEVAGKAREEEGHQTRNPLSREQQNSGHTHPRVKAENKEKHGVKSLRVVLKTLLSGSE